MTDLTQPGRRLITASGDGLKSVYRNAVEYDATAEICQEPRRGKGVIQRTGSPAVRLTVTPAGDWHVTKSTGLGGGNDPKLLASGTIEQAHEIPYEDATPILEAIANAGGSIAFTDLPQEQRLAPIWDQLLDAKLVVKEHKPGTDGNYREKRTITYAGYRHLARATNLSARIELPSARDVGPLEPGDQTQDTVPALRLAGLRVHAYVDDTGALRISAHTDSGDIPAWLGGGSREVPVLVTFNGETIFEADTVGPMAGPHRFNQHGAVTGRLCEHSTEPAKPDESCPAGCPTAVVKTYRPTHDN